MSFLDNSGFAIGTVNTAGMTTSGNLTLSSTGTVTQSQDISAAGLELLGTGGIFTLTRTRTACPLIAGDTGSANIHTDGTLSINTVNTAGFTTEGNLSLTAGGLISQAGGCPLIIGGNLSLTTTHNAGDVSINNTGASATVIGDTLVGGDYDLTATGKPISQAPGTSAKVAGAFSPTGSSVSMGNTGNIFGSYSGTSGSGTDQDIIQAGLIHLDTMNVTGNLTVISEASSESFNGLTIHGNAITLNNTSNSIGGTISVTTVAPEITTGGEQQTGIDQNSGTTLTVAGEASFTAAASSVGGSGVIIQTQVDWLQLNTSCTNERVYRSKHRGTAITGDLASLCVKKHEARKSDARCSCLYTLGPWPSVYGEDFG